MANILRPRQKSNGIFTDLAVFENILVQAAGDYQVTLRVTDNLGAQAESAAIWVRVNENLPPVVALTCSVPDAISSPLLVHCQSTISDVDGTINQISIDWGDGNNNYGMTDVDHNYASGGTKTITLTAQDDLGATSSATQTVHLNNVPVAAFTCFHINSLTIKCDASASTDDGSIVSYNWNIGGIVKTGAVVTQQFLQEENIIVSLTVTDDRGLQSSQDQWFQVLLDPDIKLPLADFEYSIEADKVVHFDANESSFDGRIVTKYVWDLGDGTIIETSNPILEHTYQNFGWYTVSLLTTNQNGVESSLEVVTLRVHTPNVANPGIAFEQTLEGIDSDNDGLRDDLQRWVDEKFGENQNKWNAWRQYALNFQQNLVAGLLPEQRNTIADAGLDSFRCILFVSPTEESVNDKLAQFKGRAINTRDRYLTYIEILRAVQGQPVTENNDSTTYGQYCNFELIAQ